MLVLFFFDTFVSSIRTDPRFSPANHLFGTRSVRVKDDNGLQERNLIEIQHVLGYLRKSLECRRGRQTFSIACISASLWKDR
mmetsp:Transcript_50498/g.51383  ORF Transcript_50498/g.51383 Transcript_50498/m.51383 type:complete len:82 (-) Transcript_50498:820-1065(-)